MKKAKVLLVTPNFKGIEDGINKIQSSLVKVDGFSGREDFENFVNVANTEANLLLKTRNPKRFIYKYGKNAEKSAFVKQT